MAIKYSLKELVQLTICALLRVDVANVSWFVKISKDFSLRTLTGGHTLLSLEGGERSLLICYFSPESPFELHQILELMKLQKGGMNG